VTASLNNPTIERVNFYRVTLCGSNVRLTGEAENAGMENAGVENAASDYRGGKRGSGNRGSLKSMESEDFKNVFLTVLTERIASKLTQTLLLHKGGLSREKHPQHFAVKTVKLIDIKHTYKFDCS